MFLDTQLHKCYLITTDDVAQELCTSWEHCQSVLTGMGEVSGGNWGRQHVRRHDRSQPCMQQRPRPLLVAVESTVLCARRRSRRCGSGSASTCTG